MDRRFRKPDIEKLFGIKTTRLHEWLKFRYIDDDIVPPGQGYKYEFGFFDLCSIVMLDNLIGQGFTRVYAGETVKMMRRHVIKYGLKETLPKYFIFGEKLSDDQPKRRTGLKITSVNNLNDKVFDLAAFSANFDHIFIFDFSRIIDRVRLSIS